MSSTHTSPQNQTSGREKQSRVSEQVESKDSPESEGLLNETIQLAHSRPGQLAPREVLALQRAVGNRAVRRVVQAKLTVGAADDPYEREADRVAEQVMTMPAPAPQRESLPEEEEPLQGKFLHREAAPEEEEIQTKPIRRSGPLEEDELQTKPIQRSGPLDEEELQMKPIRRSGPLDEEELQMKPVQRSGPLDEEELQMKPIRRSGPLDEDELQMKPIRRDTSSEEEEPLQGKFLNREAAPEDPMGAFDAGEGFENRLNSARGGGQPLPGEVRDFMEPRFNSDFSDVRLHTGSESADLNREISARAFTVGQDIYLGQGEENVSSDSGRSLLAHELAHVNQQTGSRPLQRQQIQRFISLADWKSRSSVAFSSRSASLKKIDALVEAYNKIAKENTDQRLKALDALETAIVEWKNKKGATSKRMNAVNDLLTDVQVEKQAIKIQSDKGKPTETTPPTNITPEEPTEEDQALDEELKKLEAEMENGEGEEDTEESPKSSLKKSQEELDMDAELDREELDTLRVMIQAQKAIIQSIKDRLAMAKEWPPEKQQALMDEIRELMAQSDEIGDALAQHPDKSLEDDEDFQAELDELGKDVDVIEDEGDKAIAELEAEMENEGPTDDMNFDVDDPEDIEDLLAAQEDKLGDMEEQARQQVLKVSQEGKIVGALLPQFIAYKKKKSEHGAHGIKSEVVQGIIDTMMGKDEFLELYALDTERGDLAIQKAAEMAFGDVWTVHVSDGFLDVVNTDADAALKAIAAPLKAECEKIAKATPEQLQAALELLAQAQLEAKKSGERGTSLGPVDLTGGGSLSGYIGAKANAKVSATVDKLAKSIKLVAEASAQAGMGADMTGFIKAAIGENFDVKLEAKLGAFFGIKGSVSGTFEATLTSIRAEALASAFVGAQVTGSASATARYKHTEGTVDAEGEAMAGAKAEVKGTVLLDKTGLSLKGSAEAFAGAKATGSVGVSSSYKGRKMFSMRAKAEGWAGVGAKASGEFTFKDGKLHISAEVGTALGLGGELGTEIEIDFKVIGAAILAEMKEFYDMIFPPDIDRRSPDGLRPTGLTSENTGRLYMAVYPAFVAYGKKKASQGEHGLKRERLQEIIDKNVILNKALTQKVGEVEKPLYQFVEADKVLIYTAMSALGGQLNSIDVQYGQIRSMDAVAKELYVGLT